MDRSALRGRQLWFIYVARCADDDVRVTIGYKGVPFVENEVVQLVWLARGRN